jgi:hypothetical protein
MGQLWQKFVSERLRFTSSVGIHDCDLDDWLQAERELQEKYNKSKDGGPKKK